MGTEAAVAPRRSPGLQEYPAPDGGMYYPGNGYAAPQQYFYDYNSGGYAESPGVSAEQWEEYVRYMGMDSGEAQTPQGLQGYGYPGQPPFSPYGPGSPAIGADGQLYGPQAGFQYPGQMYAQPSVSPGGQFLPPGTQQGGQQAGDAGLPIVNGTPHEASGGQVPMGSRPGGLPVALIPAPMAYGRMPGVGTSVQDVRFDVRVGHWPDGGKGAGGPPVVGSAPMRVMASQGMAIRPLAPLQVLPRNMPNGFGRGRGGGGPVFPDSRGGGRGWNGAFDRGRGRGRGGGGYAGNGTSLYDVATEQNRGPRTIRLRGQRVAPVPLPGGLDAASYNKPDFVTKYETARLFVIKSYSEDDVHKSIKYSVWASTPTGNKRLEAAYQEAQAAAEAGKARQPIFLLFSVNASGQFCGVAEMVGPVDHSKSVEYWQQDKWNGQFAVQWHLIKDVPNSHFRHIILPNNEGKPVTNSRDTQEVPLEQGLEMLEIFKNFVAKTSILDDFTFYDDRQKSMQEKRSRQQQQQRQRQMMKQAGGAAGSQGAAASEETQPGNETSASLPSLAPAPAAASSEATPSTSESAEPEGKSGEDEQPQASSEESRSDEKPSANYGQTLEAAQGGEGQHSTQVGEEIDRRLQAMSVNN